MAGFEWGSLADWFAAVGTIGACGIALYLARAQERQQDSKRADRSRAFAVLVRAEISATQARTIGLRNLLAAISRTGRATQAANWPTIVSTVNLLELPVAERLIDQTLDLDPTAVKSTCDTLAMTAQMKLLVAGWGDASALDPQSLQSAVSALRILTIGLQLQVNLAHDDVWKASKPIVAPPAAQNREVSADELALYQGYMSENGLNVSRLFPVRSGLG
ncbi:MAG TPA: hypothetical protein VN153_12780 [Tahibacter sp.]|nr:hypothetical protein [Tahibacter sp.]